MFSWGVITIGIGGVQNDASLSGVRYLLGVFEAGELSMFEHTTRMMA